MKNVNLFVVKSQRDPITNRTFCFALALRINPVASLRMVIIAFAQPQPLCCDTNTNKIKLVERTVVNPNAATL